MSLEQSVEMAVSAMEKAFCDLELSKTESVTIVQWNFWTLFEKEPPTRIYIYDWFKKFEAKGCLCKVPKPGWPSISADVVATQKP